jgi:hypothetical protein
MKFLQDQLYSFKYRPITPKQILKVWDAKPLMFALDISPTKILGINLHWIKVQHQQEFLDEIQKILLKSKGNKDKIRLTYLLLKKPKFRYAIEGIRLYYASRITNLQAIPESKWSLVLKYKKYKEKIKEYKTELTNETVSNLLQRNI